LPKNNLLLNQGKKFFVSSKIYSIYHPIKKLLMDVALEVPTLSEAVRKDIDMWEYTFKTPTD